MNDKIIVTTHEEEIEKFTYESHKRIEETRKKILEVYTQLNKIHENIDNVLTKIEKPSIKILNNNKD